MCNSSLSTLNSNISHLKQSTMNMDFMVICDIASLIGQILLNGRLTKTIVLVFLINIKDFNRQ